MNTQIKRDLQATALVVGLFAGGTALSYFALRPTFQTINKMAETKLALTEAYMVINRMNEIAPDLVQQACTDVHDQIVAGLQAAAVAA